MERTLGSMMAIGAIAVSLLQPQRACSQDVLTTSSDLYTMLGDTLNARAMMATFPAGSVAPWHSHPPHMVYVLEGGSMEITPKGKKPVTVEFKPGMFVISPSEVHMAKNVGTTTIKALVIELNETMAKEPKR